MSLVPKDWSKEIEKLRKKSAERQQNTKQVQARVLAQLSRPVQKTSIHYYQLYRKFWYWSFASLPLDLVLLLTLPLVTHDLIDSKLQVQCNYILLALTALSLIWFIKDFMISRLTGVNDLRGSIFKLLNSKPWLIFVLLAAFIVFEILTKANQVGILGMLAIGLIIFISSAKSVQRGIKDSLLKHENYKQDLTIQVEVFNKFVFNVHLIPMLSARILIFLSCLIIPLSEHFEPYFYLYVCFGCVLISLMQTEEKFFMIHCQRCGVKTSRFLAKQKECLSCIIK